MTTVGNGQTWISHFSSEGTHHIEVTVTDSAGNQQSAEASVQVEVSEVIQAEPMVGIKVVPTNPEPGDGTQPPTPPGEDGTQPPTPEGGDYNTFGRCGDDHIKVYYFSAGTRHHLAVRWDVAQRIFPGWGESWIGWLSQADCNRWTLGRAYGETEACRTEHARCR